jgi:hypothetical protein
LDKPTLPGSIEPAPIGAGTASGGAFSLANCKGCDIVGRSIIGNNQDARGRAIIKNYQFGAGQILKNCQSAALGAIPVCKNYQGQPYKMQKAPDKPGLCLQIAPPFRGQP